MLHRDMKIACAYRAKDFALMGTFESDLPCGSAELDRCLTVARALDSSMQVRGRGRSSMHRRPPTHVLDEQAD